MSLNLYLSEQELQDRLVAYARVHGWRCHFVPDSLYRRSFTNKSRGYNALDLGDKGFPDLLMIHGKNIWYRELKVKYNKLSPEQVVWRDMLLAAGQDWALWHPKTMDDLHAIEESIKKKEGVTIWQSTP